MSEATISVGAYVLGTQVSVAFSRTDDGAGQWSQSPAAAAPGDLTTRTDDNTGVVTLDAGHSIVTGKVDVFWDGGRRYNVDATVIVNACSIDGGAGDVLPADETPVSVCQQVIVNAAFDPDDVSVLLVTATKRASIVLVDSGGAALLALDLEAGECCLWWEDGGIDRPFTGNAVAAIWMTNGDDDEANTITVSVLYDATP